MSVFTVAQVKPLIGVSGASQDALLQVLLDAIEQHVQFLTGFRLAPVSVTEWYCGNWSRSLRLRQKPVRSITSVRIWPGNDNQWGQGDSSNPPEALEAGKDYFLKIDWQSFAAVPVAMSMSGLLVRPGNWPGTYEKRRGRIMPKPVEGNGNIEVTYACGFPTSGIPAEFLPAVAAGVKLLYIQDRTGGAMLNSEGLDGLSLSFSPGGSGAAEIGAMVGQLGEVRTLIARYCRTTVR